MSVSLDKSVVKYIYDRWGHENERQTFSFGKSSMDFLGVTCGNVQPDELPDYWPLDDADYFMVVDSTSLIADCDGVFVLLARDTVPSFYVAADYVKSERVRSSFSNPTFLGEWRSPSDTAYTVLLDSNIAIISNVAGFETHYDFELREKDFMRVYEDASLELFSQYPQPDGKYLLVTLTAADWRGDAQGLEPERGMAYHFCPVAPDVILFSPVHEDAWRLLQRIKKSKAAIDVSNTE